MTEQLFNSQQPQQGRWLEWAVPAVLDLAGTLFTNSSNSNNVDKQNAFNMAMQDKQNEYNSPLNQKRLYEQAGINPAFLFGGQSGLDSTSGLAQSAGVSHYEKPDFNSIARNLFESKRLQNETLKNEFDIKETITKTESYKLAMEQSKARFDKELAEIQSRTDLNDEDKRLRTQQIKTEQLNQAQVIYNTENIKYQTQLLEQKAITEGWSQKQLQAQINRVITLTPIEAHNLMSQSHLNQQQAEVAAETINKVKSEVVNLIKQGRYIDAQAISQIIDNQVKDVEANNKIRAAYVTGSDDLVNLIYEHTNGVLGDIAKFISGVIARPYKKTTRDNNFFRNAEQRSKGSSWLFE